MNGDGQRDRRVEDEVEGDIEKSTSIRRPRRSRDSAIKPVGQATDQDENDAQPEMPERN
jgi:hypothetical protein